MLMRQEEEGSGPPAESTDETPEEKPDAKPKPKAPTAPVLDPTKMQEMLNPQTMQTYLSQVRPALSLPHKF